MKTKISKITSSVMVCSLLLTGCGNKNTTDTNDLNIKKVTDYLYEATLDYDFDLSIAKDYYAKYMPDLGGCSAISIGNIRGRNYDWEYSNGTEFIVKTTAKTGENERHASIGVSSLTGLANEEANDGQYHEQYNMLPFVTLDGVNDAGIYVNVNVVRYQEMGEWGMKTESTDDDMCELAGPRIILDNCAYLSDIVPEYEKYDWFSIGALEETHIMVTGMRSEEDPTVSTVVFEFIPFTEDGKTFRKLCCISNNEEDKVLVGNDDSRFYKINTKNLIMTNFNLWQYDPSLATREERLDTASPSPMGYERYETLELAGGTLDTVTKDQMADIMKKVYFSNTYNLFQNNFWYSDYDQITKDQIKSLTKEEMNPNGDIEKIFKGIDNCLYDEVKSSIDTWNERDRTKTKEQNLWETIHTTVFDYDTKSFRIIPHEGSIYYEFSLV